MVHSSLHGYRVSPVRCLAAVPMVLALLALVGISSAIGQDADKAAKLAELKQKFESERSLTPYTKRTSTLSALGSLGTEAAAQFLASVAENTAEERYIRRYALSNCGRCKIPSMIPLLTKYADDADSYVAGGALDGLGNYGKDAPLDVLEKAATDPDVSKSSSAINAMIRANPADLNDRLRRLADTVTAPSTGATIVDRLAREKHPDTLNLIKKYLAEWPSTQDIYRGRLITAMKTMGMTVETMELALEQLNAEGSGSYTKKAVREAMESVEPGPVLDWLIDNGLDHDDADVRALIIGAIGKVKSERAAEALIKALKKEKEPTAQLALVDALVAQGPAACDAAFDELKSLMDDKEEAIAVAAIHALGYCREHADDRAVLGKLRRTAKSNRAGNAQGEAIIALARLGDDDAMDLAKKGMKSRDWRVAAASVQAMRVLRNIECVDLLIEALEKAEGRLRGDITLALKDLTGKSLPDDEQVWRTWWRANKEGFILPPPIAQRDNDANQMQGGGTGFYGMEVRSHRVCFILDVSGSMSAQGKFVPTGMPANTTTRLDVAKHQLNQVIDQFAKMDAKVKFNIIFFHSNPEPWQEGLVPTKDQFLNDARTYIQKQNPRGGTNIYDTLEQAMKDPEVDTIYMLTDGAPGSGQYVTPDDICREIRRINRTRRIVINTIGIEAAGSQEAFLKRLAEENGGQFVNR